MIINFDQLFKEVKNCKSGIIAVAAAEDEKEMMSLYEAKKAGIADSILIGDIDRINRILRRLNIEKDVFQIIDEKDPAKSCEKAVELVKRGKANILMKGLVDSAVMLKAVLNKEKGIKRGKLLSHVAVMEMGNYHKLLFMTDGGVVISPGVDEKVQIIRNTVEMVKKFGEEMPKVVLLSATEKVNDRMQSTVDAARIKEMAAQGLIKDAIIDGPLGFDNAISERAAAIKGMSSPVSGQADIFVMPSIEAANIMYKACEHFANAKVSGIVVGADVPIIINSRADNSETKLRSIAVAVLAGSKGE